ncbi:MAG TPA: HlyD family efflux transporter periplasmic adaptor subunit [Gammaproteobacteria bacterium]|nr:HlyD family efflux transporter periplasmic adaptor subunit [Xanthomonadales bacterium]HPI95129.1 HlyD family efflux transporter periplasmic adaptor subunit [Gammaproteobacteria bacterium]HPQ86887.1 HlyD family efflux transporter periplasmic adaptor subunit [Gammaproteobacteria bacterium]
MMPVFSVLLLFLANFHADAETIYITGTNESKNSQKVLMPLVPSFQGKISEMAEEGIKVEKGDFLLRIDGSSLDSQINAQIEELEVFKATSKKERIELKIQLNNAEIAYQRAVTDLKIAEKEAQIPQNYIGDLAYKQNQLQLKNSEKNYEKAKSDLKELKTKISEKEVEIELGIKQKQDKLDYLQGMLDEFTIYAEQDGYVVYLTKSWTGEKIQIGDQLNSGQEILSVSRNTDMHIIAWLNAIDLPKIRGNKKVKIRFDAFLDEVYSGEIVQIASAGEDMQVWGDGLYYEAIVELTGEKPNGLMHGMSALIELELENIND